MCLKHRGGTAIQRILADVSKARGGGVANLCIYRHTASSIRLATSATHIVHYLLFCTHADLLGGKSNFHVKEREREREREIPYKAPATCVHAMKHT